MKNTHKSLFFSTMCLEKVLFLHQPALETAQVIKTEAEDNTHSEVIVVSKNEKDYSDCIQYSSSLASVLSLLGGFTFAAFMHAYYLPSFQTQAV